MTVSLANPRQGPTQGRLLWPALAAGALTVAVVIAPFRLASAWRDGGYPARAALVDSLSAAVVRFWSADATAAGPDLALRVSFWWRFHLIKAVLAAVLLGVLVLLGARTWGSYTGATTAGRRVALGVVAGTEGLVALLALLVTVANLQGAVAPLSSALGLLPLDTSDPAMAGTIDEIRESLAAGTRGPALQALLADLTRYHVAMAVLLTAAFFAVVTAGNVSTVANPAPALLAFVGGPG